ncbi:MAG: hypothetical protein EPO02_13810 [Nitrospirae bacterium]|nr:MAG: hypothetical protein EPO02_13810 [Nitrospirota bacterium]
MTAITNTATTLTTKGIRESLEDVVHRVAPTKTPFQDNVASSPKPKTTFHEWQTETPTAPASTNYQLEGDDLGSTYGAEVVTTRVGNYCQIFRKSGIVSATDQAVVTAGRDNELNRQRVIKAIELKTDMEMTFMANLGSGAESGATPRKCGGFQAWITSNKSLGAGGSTTGFSSGTVTAATAGTTRTYTETLFKAVRATAFSNGATPSQVYMNGTTKQQMSAFTGIASIRVNVGQNEQATIIGAADVYLDDFGKCSLIPHQYALATAAVLLVDPEYVGISTLRGMTTEMMAKTGDADKFMLIAEKTLVMKNEKAHAVIFAV